MFKNLLSFLLCVLFSTLTLTSCSNDEEESGSKGSFIIDGENYRVEMASCTDGVQEEYANAGCFFEAILYGDEDAYHFTVELVSIYQLDKLKSGDDVTDKTGVYSLRLLTNTDFSRYQETDGKVIVKSVSNNKITLEYKNFTFNRDGSKYSYIVNGVIEYER